MMVVLAPPEFLTDARRGVNRYEALKHRIWDDVRDKHHPNPLVPLVRLSADSTSFQSLTVGSPVPSDGQKDGLMARRVIEGLRAGVPNRHIVKALGCPQGEIGMAFPSTHGRHATKYFDRTLFKGAHCGRQFW